MTVLGVDNPRGLSVVAGTFQEWDGIRTSNGTPPGRPGGRNEAACTLGAATAGGPR